MIVADVLPSLHGSHDAPYSFHLCCNALQSGNRSMAMSVCADCDVWNYLPLSTDHAVRVRCTILVLSHVC